MYKIKCEDLTLYNPLKKDLVVGDPTLNLEVNKAGSLTFSIYPTHTYYNSIRKMKSVISVYQDNRILFKGRVYSDVVNLLKVKKVEVEGLLAYFNDSIVRPYTFTGSVPEYLTFLITQHNDQVAEDQKFKIGNITVTDPNNYITRANSGTPRTWEEIEEKLIKLLGGYICIRYEDDGNYIDYLEDFTDVSTQKIKFAVNLQDLGNVVKGDSLATCIIPYGAKLSDIENEETEGEEATEEEPTDTEERVTIKSVNNDVDYIQDDEAVAIYGKIYEVVTWDDVTEPANLLTKAQLYLSNSIKLKNTLTVKAVDLHLSDDTIEAFKLGDYIEIYSSPHDIDETALLTAFSIPLANPSGCVFTLGIESDSFVDKQISTDRENSNNFQRIDIVKKEIGEKVTETIDKKTEETLTYVNEAIDNSEENTRTMLEEYAKTSDVESVRTEISTTVSQTAKEINIKFDTVNERITNENGEITKELEEINKYIRLVDGNIILGEEGNPLTTKIVNGRISFLYNDSVEVAYISDNKLYITNAEILESIIIGNFAFIPRKNGNLSFKKVR
jgi:hypothetical protein